MVDLTKRDVLSHVVRLFDEMYRKGYMDAYLVRDDGRIFEFIESTSKVGVYGVLTDGYYMSWFEYKLRLNQHIIKWTRRGVMQQILDGIQRMLAGNMTSCILPLAQSFYNAGAESYLKYQERIMAITIQTKRRYRVTSAGGKILTDRDVIYEIQQKCLDLKRRDSAVLEDEYSDYKTKREAIKPFKYDQFIYAIAAYMPVKKKEFKYDIWHR